MRDKIPPKKTSLLAAISFLALASTQPGAAAEVLKLATNPLLPSLTVPEPLAQSCRVVYPVAGDDYVTTARNTPVTFLHPRRLPAVLRLGLEQLVLRAGVRRGNGLHNCHELILKRACVAASL